MTRGRTAAWVTTGTVVAMLSLSGCSGSAGSSPTEAGGDPSAACKISFLTFQSPALSEKFWKDQVTAVQKNYPKLTVDIQYTPGLDRQAYASQLLAAGNLPDVTWDVSLPDFVKAGALLPYTESDVAKDGAPNSVGKINGKHYSLSVGSQPQPMIFYNKDTFSSLGLKVPTTYQEFADVASKLKAAGKTPLLVGGGSDPWTSTMLLNGMINTDVNAKNPNWMRDRYKDKVHFKDADFKAAVTKWQKLVTGGLINDDALSVSYAQLIAKFTNADGAMYPMGAWAASTEASFDIGVFPLPTNDGKKVVLGNLPAQRMYISAKTKCPAQARAFSVALATSPAFAGAFFKSDGLIPSLAGWSVPAGTSALQTATYKIFADKSVEFVPPFGSEGVDSAPAGFNDVFDKGAQAVMSGGSVDDFLAKLDQTFDDLNTSK